MSVNSGKLFLDFFKFIIEINCDDPEVLINLKKDFEYFVCEDKQSDFIIRAQKTESIGIPANLRAVNQTQNSITYVNKGVKYQDYYGKAWSETFAFKINFYYLEREILHELLYLAILSFSGKQMDMRGFHKIHACAVSHGKKNLVFMMPSKGGKTTLFMDLLNEPSTSIISDDTPVVNRYGRLHPFPLRVGCESKNELFNKFPYIREQDIYEFNRQYFSKKYLLNLMKLKNQIFVSPGESVFIVGFRSTRTKPVLKPLSKWRFLKELMQHMVIGVGLPLIIEHFFRLGWRDFFANFKIFISRFASAVMIVLRHEGYLMEMSQSKSENLKLVRSLFHEE